MREIIKMLVVLTLISTTTGLALGVVNKLTEEPRRQAEFKFAKEPALKEVLPDYENDLVADSFVLQKQDGSEVTIYPAKQGGEVVAVGFETSATGFGGDVRLMVGIDLRDQSLRGFGVIAHSETPGLGARLTEQWFKDQFKDGKFPVDSVLALKSDGGTIDAISGASITSGAVCRAINSAFEFFRKNQEEMGNK